MPAPSSPNVPLHPPSRRLIWLLTLATGASVANLYYNQPLLSDIARTFHATPRAVGAIATLTQAGYAVGMLLFVPLGDVVERRRLIVTLLCCVTAALLLAALGPTLGVVLVASFAIGVTTVVPQLILPFAAGLTPPAMRGRVAGQTLWGIAVGVLLLDAATQAAQVSNQARVYALPMEAHSRLNTIYMVCYFIGGSVGSALAVVAWDAFRWRGACGVALTALALAYGVCFARRDRPGL